MKLLWNTEGNHAVVRAKIREFVIVDNTLDARTDLFIKTANGANVFFQSFTNAADAKAFIEAGIKDVDKNGDTLPVAAADTDAD